MPDTNIHIWPLGLYLVLLLLLVGGIILVAYLLGQRHMERATSVPYESGIPPTGSARLRFSADFYLVAMFFVIFDLETTFVFAWAIAAREVGWAGYATMVYFVGMLVVALAYLWRSGALEWGPAVKPGERRVFGDP